jgi:hypothetical protein
MTYFSIELLSQASAYYSFRKKGLKKRGGAMGGKEGERREVNR